MSVRATGSLSWANGEYLLVDHFSGGWRLMKKEEEEEVDLVGEQHM